MTTLSCFKAYDIRGRLGDELNEQIAYRIGRAYGQFLNPRRVAVGGDVRLSSEALTAALADGLLDAGADVIDLGMTGTEGNHSGQALQICSKGNDDRTLKGGQAP